MNNMKAHLVQCAHGMFAMQHIKNAITYDHGTHFVVVSARITSLRRNKIPIDDKNFM